MVKKIVEGIASTEVLDAISEKEERPVASSLETQNTDHYITVLESQCEILDTLSLIARSMVGDMELSHRTAAQAKKIREIIEISRGNQI